MSRHARCPICQAGRLIEAEPFPGEVVAACSNPDCPTNRPTGPIDMTQRARAAAEVEGIKRELRERHDRGEL